MKSYRLEPGKKADLSSEGADDLSGVTGGKDAAVAELAVLSKRLEELQELLYAEHRHKILILLQGMDAAGKDGVIRHVFEGVNPQGTRVQSFKVPSAEELDHDYLWRVHSAVPRRGEICIFNRSHYEDVLVVRVHGSITPEEAELRFRQINDFEKMLVEEGTSIFKFFLHISPEEQRARLEQRVEDPRKHWKLSGADLTERKLWAKYMEAYAAALKATSTEWAPWTIVPANHKWYRNLVVAHALVSHLQGLGMRYPAPTIDPATVKFDD